MLLTIALVTAVMIYGSSCSDRELTGSYESEKIAGDVSRYTFEGSRVTVTVPGGPQMRGKYNIANGRLNITVEDECYSYSFSKDGDTLTVAGIRYTRIK